MIVSVIVTSISKVVGRAQDRVIHAVHLYPGTVVTVSGMAVVTILGRCPPAVYVIVRAETVMVAGGAHCGKAREYTPGVGIYVRDEQTTDIAFTEVGAGS